MRLRDVDLRITNPRLRVLAALDDHPHSTAKDITQIVRQEVEHVSAQAIYDILAAFTRAGLARCFQPAGSSARYETRTGDNHHHLVCRSCEQVTDVDCVVGAAPCLTPGDGSGYALDTAEVVFWGKCPKCQEKEEHDG